MTSRSVLAVLLCLAPAGAAAQLDTLRPGLERLASESGGRVGVAVRDIGSDDGVSLNGDDRFPMQSVYKFPLALTVLDLVDRDSLSLEQTVRLDPSDLLPDTWSPLRDRYPDGGVDVTLDDLVRSTVSLSDNNACDILFRLAGGPAAVDRHVRGLGISGMAIVSTEAQMHADRDAQYRNWSTPEAMCALLTRFATGGALSDSSTRYLWEVMAGTPTGRYRLRGDLPAGTTVAHKTGSSGTDEDGVAAATNDVGVVVLPDGRRFAIAVFISDSAADDSTRERTIARIARTVWDAYDRGRD